MTRHIPVLATFAFALAGLVACSGGPDCESVGKKLCAAACECTDGAECAFVSGSTTAGASVSFESQADCEALYLVGCALGGSTTIDYEACDLALDAPMCGMVASGNGLVSPAVCEEDDT